MIRRVLVGKGKRYYIKDLSQDYHMQYGRIKKEDLALPSGSTVTSNMDETFTVFDASFIDLYEKIGRGPQIVPRKDIGMFIAECGINKESIVIDAGTGSGAVTCMLASIAKEVHTLDVREDHFKVAQKNVETFGFDNVHMKIGSIYDEVPVENADAFFLDVPEPWFAVTTAKKALKIGGFLCSYSPCIPQVSDFVEAVRGDGSFEVLKTVEIMQREWEVEKRKIRPRSLSITHSGFLTFVRRVK